jgi:hypothetical protein
VGEDQVVGWGRVAAIALESGYTCVSFFYVQNWGRADGTNELLVAPSYELYNEKDFTNVLAQLRTERRKLCARKSCFFL